MKRRIVGCLALAVYLLVLSAVGYHYSVIDVMSGWANKLSGRVLVVSVFADDAGTCWNSFSYEDKACMDRTLDNLRIACDYIEKESAVYGSDVEFVYDYTQAGNEDLVEFISFNGCLVTDNISSEDMKEIDDYLIYKSGMYKKKFRHGADGVLYFLFLNTDVNNSVLSGTYIWEGEDCPPDEFTLMYTYYDGEPECPAAYAHEMLHCFGAPDLYFASQPGEDWCITEEYVQHLQNIDSNDIMYTCDDIGTGDVVYDKITNELTEVDAYFLGLVAESEEAEKWGIGDYCER